MVELLCFTLLQRFCCSESVSSSAQCLTPVGGSTELWRPLRALSLLPPSHGLRNLLLLSDGHIQNPELTLQLLRGGMQHSRLFACGLRSGTPPVRNAAAIFPRVRLASLIAPFLFSPTANRHMLRALAQAGGGAFEFFELTSQHTWAGKVRGHPVSPSSSALTQQRDPVYPPILRQVASQVKRMAAPGCSSVSVKWQQFNPTAPPPVQAPKQLQALFSDCHTLVYGFVPHCSQVRGLV